NSAMGYLALFDNTFGHSNSAMGALTLRNNTTGSSNSAMGFEALYDNTTGHSNSAMGHYALSNNTTGDSNMAMGTFALGNNTTGNYNVSVGGSANLYNQEGSNNTAIGFEAGRGTPFHSKSGNVFIGYQAGFNELGDNKLYIANGNSNSHVLIYGDFATGRLGLGTTSPEYTLDVRGNRIQLKDDTSG
ncbi:MAG: hypothetical protein GY869_04860, partial [Planctomycetes bacterium]|nr:hypothetical protein [Planctomycetota bacterium]